MDVDVGQRLLFISGLASALDLGEVRVVVAWLLCVEVRRDVRHVYRSVSNIACGVGVR